MARHALLIVLCLSWLAGCGSAPTAPSTAALPWQDQAFGYAPALVTVSKEDLFRPDPELLARVQSAEVRQMTAAARFKHLMAIIFGPDRQRFGYLAGHSTTAAETWVRQRGDCLSLTVLTYSAARAADMSVQMQEVQAPALFDRRGRLDVVNQHVNVAFHRAYRDLRDTEPRDVVVDFDPDFASRRPGRALSENAVLARYYNNIATEHLGQGRRELAYAHFKAAILADPGYAASYGNLAVLYRGAGLAAEAEQLLHHAIALGDSADVPLHTLHEMLMEQGRTAEAQRYERALLAGRERDPYHWIGLGLRHLDDGEVRRAIGVLETARDMASGFDEVHRYLAVAYWRAGETVKARQELALLASLTGEASVDKLRRKIKGGSPPQAAPPS
jgi:tetratricopeptide (TPR) repeat protein